MHNRTVLGLGLITVCTLALSCVDARATSKSQLQGVCKEIGGVFQDNIPGGGYACTDMDTGTDIKCNKKGKCDVATPGGVAPPPRITDALRGGKPKGAAATGSSSAGGSGLLQNTQGGGGLLTNNPATILPGSAKSYTTHAPTGGSYMRR